MTEIACLLRARNLLAVVAYLGAASASDLQSQAVATVRNQDQKLFCCSHHRPRRSVRRPRRRPCTRRQRTNTPTFTTGLEHWALTAAGSTRCLAVRQAAAHAALRCARRRAAHARLA